MPEKKASYTTEPEIFVKQLAARIKACRKATGMGMDKFAMKHDFDRSQLYRMEKGQAITMSTLNRFLRAVDISPAEFFSEGFD